MININNLTKLYSPKKGISNFTYNFEKGNVYGLIGPNGAGKTTLIKLLTNFVFKDEGYIEKNFENNEMLKNISYMPEFNILIPGTVKKNIEFFTMTYSDMNYDTLYNVLETFEIDLKDNVKKLSTGKVKALHFALTISRDAKVYIFDEPFSGIDVITRKRIVNEILKEVDIEDSTVIISSHELHDMDQLLDEVILLDKSEMITSKSVESIKEEKKSLYEWFLSNFI